LPADLTRLGDQLNEGHVVFEQDLVQLAKAP
jgi:hypothetical protein